MHVAAWKVDRTLAGWRKEVWSRAVDLLEAEDRDEVERLIEAGSVHRVRLILTELRVRSHLLHHTTEELDSLLGPHHHFDPFHLRRREPAVS